MSYISAIYTKHCMEIGRKAQLLSSAGMYDSCGPKACETSFGKGLGGIYHAKAEHKSCRLFKTLMDNKCAFDCKYCANANGSAKERAAFEPDELARLFMHLNKNIGVDGLFLSSAIVGNPDASTERMVEAVRLLRFKYNFKGYVHFKVLPGASYELVKQAAALSTRMSINLEAPNKGALSEVSSCKDYGIDILRRQAWVSRLSKSQTTQMIVRGSTTDLDMLRMAKWEYESLRLRRVYYSAFTPVEGTPMAHEAKTPLARECRLYNADFLMRCYNYKLNELRSIMEDGMLPLGDPKLALAREGITKPIDLNKASYEELIRIPGIGPKSARRIAGSRRAIMTRKDLASFGASADRAMPFVSIGGNSQSTLIQFSAQELNSLP